MTAEDVSYFVNTRRQISLNEAEVDFDRDWDDFKNSAKFSSYPKVMKYFSETIPIFKKHSAVWVLQDAGIQHAEQGITNNASESMNVVLKRLKDWKQVPLDVITVSLYQLCIYYY